MLSKITANTNVSYPPLSLTGGLPSLSSQYSALVDFRTGAMMFGLPGLTAALAVAALLLSASHSSVSMAAETCAGRRELGAASPLVPSPRLAESPPEARKFFSSSESTSPPWQKPFRIMVDILGREMFLLKWMVDDALVSF